MSTTHNCTHAPSRWLLGALVTLTHLFLLIALAGGLILVAPASAQSTEAPNTKTGSILGTVVDTNNETIPNATVILQNPVGDPLTVVTNDDGSFAFHDVTPGIAYPIGIAAAGFAEWNSLVTIEPGQDKTLNDIKLGMVAVHRAVTVTHSPKGGCCPAAQDGRAPARSRFCTKHLCNLRTSPRTSYQAAEISTWPTRVSPTQLSLRSRVYGPESSRQLK